MFDCSLPALGSSLALLFLVPLSACVCLDCDTSLILLSTFCFVVCNSANLSSIFFSVCLKSLILISKSCFFFDKSSETVCFDCLISLILLIKSCLASCKTASLFFTSCLANSKLAERLSKLPLIFLSSSNVLPVFGLFSFSSASLSSAVCFAFF